jgi:hypothetical protein
MDDDAWFAPKMFGYGAGLPIRWQGWLVTFLYVVVIAGAAYRLQDNSVALLSVVATATIIFAVIAANKTRGGWHWRWWGSRGD